MSVTEIVPEISADHNHAAVDSRIIALRNT
jgi:hypothetical protein